MSRIQNCLSSLYSIQLCVLWNNGIQRSNLIHFDNALRLVFGWAATSNFRCIWSICWRGRHYHWKCCTYWQGQRLLHAHAKTGLSRVRHITMVETSMESLSNLIHDSHEHIDNSRFFCGIWIDISESDGFIHSDQSKLSNKHIKMMMKLKSWNHLFRKQAPQN